MSLTLTDENADTPAAPAPEVKVWDTVSYEWHVKKGGELRRVTLTGLVSDTRTHKGEPQIKVLDMPGWFPLSRVTKVHEQKDEEE